MRAVNAPRLVGCLCLVTALLLACSCRLSAVTGFPWNDGAGGTLPFSQASSWPEGAEGHFTAQRRSNVYTLEKTVDVPPGFAVIIQLRRGPETDSPIKVRLSLRSKAEGSAPVVAATFPLMTERVSVALPLASDSRIRSLEVLAEEPSGDFSIESIGIGPAFRGIKTGVSETHVSSGFSLIKNQGYEELSIKEPFAGLDGPEPSHSVGGPGVLVEYGPSPRGSTLRLDARGADGTTRSFTIRTHPEGTRTTLDTGILPRDTASITLRSPEGIELKSFFTAYLGAGDYQLADLGRVLISESSIEDFSIYRWDILPSVLVFDFKDYATQDRYLKRLAFFVEKIGFRGTLAKDEDIASLHGWNAHDYRPEDLAAFFSLARKKSFPLNAEEKKLENLLLGDGVIKESGNRLEPGKGAMISITHESSAALRWTFAVHESTHGLFFSDAEYRTFARALWSSLDQKEKWFWKTYLGWAGYDVGSDYLMGNEFQAYLLQQPIAAAEEYFTRRKTAELLEKHPELEEKVTAYMKEFGATFARRAQQLDAWLGRKYGVEAGRTVFLTPRQIGQ